MSGTEAHPILGMSPENAANSILKVAPIASRTEALPPLQIPEGEPTRYYKCTMQNFNMIRTDGKKLAFVHGILETRDMNDIVYLDYELETKNPFLRKPTDQEIQQYKMMRDPFSAVRERITPEVEAALQEKLSAQLAAVVSKMDLPEEKKAELMASVAPAPSLSDEEKIAGTSSKLSKLDIIRMGGAKAMPVPTDDSFARSVVGSNQTPNAAQSNVKS